MFLISRTPSKSDEKMRYCLGFVCSLQYEASNIKSVGDLCTECAQGQWCVRNYGGDVIIEKVVIFVGAHYANIKVLLYMVHIIHVKSNMHGNYLLLYVM